VRKGGISLFPEACEAGERSFKKQIKKIFSKSDERNMISNYLKTALRNILKNKTFSFITIFGLALSIATFLCIAQYVYHQRNFDTFWKNADNLYRISMEQYKNETVQFQSARALMGLGMVIKEEIPGIAQSARMLKDKVTVYTPDIQIKEIDIFFADSTVFRVLHHNILAGDPQKPFVNIHSAAISQSLAHKLYGNESAIGKRFKLNEGWEFFVSCVFENTPETSHTNIDMLINISSLFYYIQNFNNATGQLTQERPNAGTPPPTEAWTWRANNAYTYVLLAENADVRSIENTLPDIIDKYAHFLAEENIHVKFHLQPIRGIHLNSHLENEIQVNGDSKSVSMLFIIGLIILVIAWVNSVNLSLARSMDRHKEIGIRKAVGANRSQLLWQFLLETVILNGVSIVLAFCIFSLLRNFIQPVLGIRIPYSFANMQLFITIALILIAGTLLSGLYPAIVNASAKPVHILKGRYVGTAKSSHSKNILMMFQFAISIILLITTFLVFQQIRFMRLQSLGVDLDQVLVTHTPMSMIKKPDEMQKLETFKTEIMRIPGVEDVTVSSSVPGKEIYFSNGAVRKVTDAQPVDHTFSIYNVDEKFFATYDIDLVDGELFQKEQVTNIHRVILNELAVKQLGYDSPNQALNQSINVQGNEYVICGIVKNHHNQSLKKSLDPILFFKSYDWYLSVGYYSIKINTMNSQKTIKDIQDVWDRIYPLDHFSYTFAQDTFNAQYEPDKQFGKTITIFTLIAVLISCMGLFGLCSHSAAKRKKELGIRQVLGASFMDLSIILTTDYGKWIVIANLFAWPIAWIAMDRWLQNFAYRITLTVWPFLLAGFSVLIIALLTISWLTIRAATANPVESLRYE
jgi:putative ABC transport system permease protein